MAALDSLPRAVLDGLAAQILHDNAHGRVIVAIDGTDVEAVDTFGDELVAALKKRGHSAFAAHLSDFAAARDRREAWGADSPEGRYRNTYDYSALRRVLIEPFRMGGSTGFVAAHFDRDREQQVEPKWLTAPDDAILVVTGEFMQRPELKGVWNFTAWLDSAAAGSPDAVTATARKLYAKDVKARQSADAIVAP